MEESKAGIVKQIATTTVPAALTTSPVARVKPAKVRTVVEVRVMTNVQKKRRTPENKKNALVPSNTVNIAEKNQGKRDLKHELSLVTHEGKLRQAKHRSEVDSEKHHASAIPSGLDITENEANENLAGKKRKRVTKGKGKESIPDASLVDASPLKKPRVMVMGTKKSYFEDNIEHPESAPQTNKRASRQRRRREKNEITISDDDNAKGKSTPKPSPDAMPNLE